MQMSEEARQRIISASITFMTEVSHALDDSDLALQIFEKLGDAIDPAIKGEVLFAMIMGQGSSVLHVRLNDAAASNQYIAAIKAHRGVTGEGLKEAKDAVDWIRNHTDIFHKIEISKNYQGKFADARKELMMAGFEVQ